MSCFPDWWKVSFVVSVFKNVGETCTTKNFHPVSFLIVVNKVFENLVNDRLADHLEKSGWFFGFQYGFRSSGSTADLPTIVSDRIARAFNSFRATLAVALDMCKVYDRVCHAGLLHKLKPYFVLFLSNRWLGDVVICWCLMVLSAILLAILMILLSTASVIRHQIFVATTRIGFWTWIWSTRHCGLG